MENCLKTQLKGIVENNGLPRFNAIRVNILDGASQASIIERKMILQASSNNKVYVEIAGDGYFCDENGNNIGTRVNILNTNTPVYYSANTKLFIIYNKDYLDRISNYSTNTNIAVISIDDIAYLDRLTSLNLGGKQHVLKLDDLKYMPMILDITFNDVNVSGHIVDLKNIPTLQYMNYYHTGTIQGDFAELAPYRAAGTLTVATNKSDLTCNGVPLYESGGIVTRTLTFDGQGGVTMS